jgi:hypothetical protein
MSLLQDGLFNSLRGGAIVLGGLAVPPTIARLSNRRYTMLCNACGAMFFGIKAAARSPLVYMSCMLPYTLGSGEYRAATINAQLIKHALKAGMKEGETAAAQANNHGWCCH